MNHMKAGAITLSGKKIPVNYLKPDISDKIIVVFPLWAGTMPPVIKTFVEAVGKENIIEVILPFVFDNVAEDMEACLISIEAFGCIADRGC